MISSPTVLGSPLLKTQHFIGASRWELASPRKAIGYHQLRVPHQKYKGDSNGGLGEIDFKGHAHGSNVHWYEKTEDGVWKFAGLKPEIRWGEFEFERVFETGRGEYGTEEKKKKNEEEDVKEDYGAKVNGHNGKVYEEEKEKVEAGKIMGGIDASAAAAATPNGSINGNISNGHIDPLVEQQQKSAQEPIKEELQATPVPADATSPSSPSAVHTPTSKTSASSDGVATPATDTSSPPEATEPSSYQANLIQEKKDKFYEQAEAVAAAEEVQMYAGAMADGLDHLGSISAKAKGMEAGALVA